MNFGATMFESDKDQSFFHFDKPEPACLRNPPGFRRPSTYCGYVLGSGLEQCIVLVSSSTPSWAELSLHLARTKNKPRFCNLSCFHLSETKISARARATYILEIPAFIGKEFKQTPPKIRDLFCPKHPCSGLRTLAPGKWGSSSSFGAYCTVHGVINSISVGGHGPMW